MTRDPMFGVVIGGVYKHKQDKDRSFIVESVTAYNSEGRLMYGRSEYPIYHAKGTLQEGQAILNNVRFATDYIGTQFELVCLKYFLEGPPN